MRWDRLIMVGLFALIVLTLVGYGLVRLFTWAPWLLVVAVGALLVAAIVSAFFDDGGEW